MTLYLEIAETFFYTGLIERWGSGPLRIAEELHASELPPPQFISESGRFRLSSLFKPTHLTQYFIQLFKPKKTKIMQINYISVNPTCRKA